MIEIAIHNVYCVHNIINKVKVFSSKVFFIQIMINRHTMSLIPPGILIREKKNKLYTINLMHSPQMDYT